MRVKVLAHCSIVSKQLAATLQHQQHIIGMTDTPYPPITAIFHLYFGYNCKPQKAQRNLFGGNYDDSISNILCPGT